MGIMRRFFGLVGGLVGLAIFSLPGTSYAMPFADNVVSFSGGTGSGVFNAGGCGAIATGPGTFDASAVTALDSCLWAMGGTAAAPGQIVLSFTTGAVVDGIGPDLRVYDTIGGSEGIIVEASSDGTTFVSLGFDDGLPSTACSLAVPCTADFDLLGSGLASATTFRLTVTDRVITNFPQAYDLDAVEALNFSAVAEPATLAIIGLGLAGLGLARRRKAV